MLGLSGTAFSHSPLDAYAVFRALGVKLAPSYRRFVEQYGQPEEIWDGRKVRIVYKTVRPAALPELQAKIAPVFHHVPAGAADLDLPQATDQEIEVELSAASRRVYDELAEELISQLDGRVITAANALVLTTRLSQITGGFSRDADTGAVIEVGREKRGALFDILEGLAEPVVVFARFRAELDVVRAVAGELGRVYGEISGRAKDGLTSDGLMGPQDIVGVQVQAGGVGVDLTRARVGIYFSLAWSLSDYLQSRKRLDRPGQTRPVLFLHILGQGTIDRAVYAALAARQELVTAVVDYVSTSYRAAA